MSTLTRALLPVSIAATMLVTNPLAAAQEQGSEEWSQFHPWYCNSGYCLQFNPEDHDTGESMSPCSATGFFAYFAVHYCVYGSPY